MTTATLHHTNDDGLLWLVAEPQPEIRDDGLVVWISPTETKCPQGCGENALWAALEFFRREWPKGTEIEVIHDLCPSDYGGHEPLKVETITVARVVRVEREQVDTETHGGGRIGIKTIETGRFLVVVEPER